MTLQHLPESCHMLEIMVTIAWSRWVVVRIASFFYSCSSMPWSCDVIRINISSYFELLKTCFCYFVEVQRQSLLLAIKVPLLWSYIISWMAHPPRHNYFTNSNALITQHRWVPMGSTAMGTNYSLIHSPSKSSLRTCNEKILEPLSCTLVPLPIICPFQHCHYHMPAPIYIHEYMTILQSHVTQSP